jgi:hypothetical protein
MKLWVHRNSLLIAIGNPLVAKSMITHDSGRPSSWIAKLRALAELASGCPPDIDIRSNTLRVVNANAVQTETVYVQ